MQSNINSYLKKETNSSTLVLFRIGFGCMMLFSILRFWAKGWIETLYIQPTFHFSYYGFEWVKPLGNFTYLLFILCAIASIGIVLGYRYKLSIITFFLCFTYIELMDKTTYLNHYYFISILSFLLCFLPANASFSLDAIRNRTNYLKVPQWHVDVLKLLVSIVYFYAGLAKINSDWLLHAMPLKIWLRSFYDLPFIGENLLQMNWFHYAMSWGGMLYDLAIPFVLLSKKTRLIGFAMVVFFHLFTYVLFPIGMFPYIMIFCSLLFFSNDFHTKCLEHLKSSLKRITNSNQKQPLQNLTFKQKHPKIVGSIIIVFFCIQLLLPFRYILYPNHLFWSEEGYRFSWRVMLMEKMGYTNFKITNLETGASYYIDNAEYLTPLQEKQMSFQPDFILEFAHHLGRKHQSKGMDNIAVYAESYVALNGRKSKRFIDPNVDLLQQIESFKSKTWVLPYQDED